MKFSVLMAIYSGDNNDYLAQALESLEKQTLRPEEVVIVFDGPVDCDLSNTVYLYAEKHNTKVLALKENRGFAFALNEGLKVCSNELVARMDPDDISYPGRFNEQVSFMENNPSISVCGTLIDEVDMDMSKIGVKKVPELPNELNLFAKKRCPLCHPTVMYRKSIVLEIGGYPLFRKGQDYGLWSMMLNAGHKFYNIQKPLLAMRCGGDLYNRRGFKQLMSEVKVFHLQYKIGFVGPLRYVMNVSSRVILRLSPVFLKSLMYKAFR